MKLIDVKELLDTDLISEEDFAKYPASDGWTSVLDSLPEDGDEVTVAVKVNSKDWFPEYKIVKAIYSDGEFDTEKKWYMHEVVSAIAWKE